MADTNTTFLSLVKVEVGASGDTWGTKLNANADAVDALFGAGPALLLTRGGTGATTAAAARTNLGLIIGTNIQAWDADLDAIAALAGTSGLLRKNAANSWSLDTTVFAPLAAPTFTGIPAAPTAAADTNTTQLATTAYVIGQASAVTPAANGTAAVGTSLRYARADHVHPSDTSLAPLASPTFTGTPAAPTAAVDTNTTQLATTAYVVNQGYLKSATASSTYLTSATAASTYLTSATASSTYLPSATAASTYATIATVSGIVSATTANVLNATAAGTAGAVGTYAFLRFITLTDAAAGTTHAGSALYYANANGGPGASGGSPAGTWRLMGATSSAGQPQSTSVWLRIS